MANGRQLEKPLNGKRSSESDQFPKIISSIAAATLVSVAIIGREVSSTLANRSVNATVNVIEQLFSISVAPELRNALNDLATTTTAWVYFFGTLDLVIKTRERLNNNEIGKKQVAAYLLFTLANALNTGFSTYGTTVSTLASAPASNHTDISAVPAYNVSSVGLDIAPAEELSEGLKAGIITAAVGAALYTLIYYALSLAVNKVRKDKGEFAQIRYGFNLQTLIFAIVALLSQLSGATSAYFSAQSFATAAGLKWGPAEIVPQIIPVVMINAWAQLPPTKNDIANIECLKPKAPAADEAQATLISNDLKEVLLSPEEQAEANDVEGLDELPEDSAVVLAADRPVNNAIPRSKVVYGLYSIGFAATYLSTFLNSAGGIGQAYENFIAWGLTDRQALHASLGLGVPTSVVLFLVYRRFRSQNAIDGVARVGNLVWDELAGFKEWYMQRRGGAAITPSSTGSIAINGADQKNPVRDVEMSECTPMG